MSSSNEHDPIEIRLMAAAEASLVADLLLGAYGGDFSLTVDYLAEIGAVAERADRHEVWVAVDTTTGALLGTVATPRAGGTISPLAREGELDFRFLGVAHAARGRGVGEQLVRHVLALAAARGLARVVMNTGGEMVAAQRLYDRMGFVRLHEREFMIERADGTSFLLIAYGREAESGPGPRARTAA